MSNVGLGFSVAAPASYDKISPLRVGGQVGAWVTVHHIEALSAAYAHCRQLGLKRVLIGSGSRTMVRSGGFSGAIVQLGHGFMGLRGEEAGLWAGSALPVSVLSRLPGLDSLATWRGSLGASLLLDPGWTPWVKAVRFVQRTRVDEGALEDVLAKGKGVVITEALFATPPSGTPTPTRADVGRWFVGADKEKLSPLFSRSGLGDTRLRGGILPKPEPTVPVNLGEGTLRDFELLHKSVADRLFKERGVKVSDELNWLGRR